MKMISSIWVIFILLPYMKMMAVIFGPVNGWSQVGALHADSHTSHLHAADFQLNMPRLLCLEGLRVGCGASLRGEHR